MKKRLLVIGGVAAGPKAAVRGYDRAHYYPGIKESALNELDKNKEIAVHCESGLRSYKACLKLRHVGIENIRNVDGGMLCWVYDLESRDEIAEIWGW